jgi:hypothetical protein
MVRSYDTAGYIVYTYWLGMRVITLLLSPRYHLFSEATPRKIVGTEGTIKVILPEYPVYKCFIILNNCAIKKKHKKTQIEWIRVITKLPNSEQSSKGKVKTHKYIYRQNQSTTGNIFYCNTIYIEKSMRNIIISYIHMVFQLIFDSIFAITLPRYHRMPMMYIINTITL